METTPSSMSFLDFLHVIEPLKHIPRTGWLRTIENPESVAAHSFRVAIMAMLTPNHLNVDVSKCVQMALVHDLAESVIGDIPTYAEVPKEKKYAMESIGFQYLENLLLAYSRDRAVKFRELWEEYEMKETPEAKLVNELDKLECLIQAHEYEQRTFGKKDLEEFQGLKAKIHSEDGCKWADYLSQERSKNLSRRAQRLPIIFIIGDLSLGEKVAEAVADKLPLAHISVDKVVQSRANDPKYLHHQVMQNCLEKELDLPANLVVDLVENEIENVRDRQWTLISGFPKDTEQLACFEKKVQHANSAIWVESSTTPILDDPMQSWKPSINDFKKILKTSDNYFELVMPETKQLCEVSEELINALINGDGAKI